MSPIEKTVAEHYINGDLLQAIKEGIAKLGKTVDSVTVEDLGPVDEFHIGSREATENLMDQLNFLEQDHILDVGCGLGGASRFVANAYNSKVTGIDLVGEYIETGKALCDWVNLDKRVTLQKESALSMSFEDETFDGGYILHVGMNIEDKVKLFKEIYRVLRPGASFGVYDIMRNKEGTIAYPVPWAGENSTCKLATPEQYTKSLSDAGFEVSKRNNRRDFAIDFFRKLRTKTEANGGPAFLGLHTLMKESTSVKIKNMIDNIVADYIAPVEIIAQKC